MPSILWYNGGIAKALEARPSIASHSLHYGVGIFDGLMAYWNEDHYYLHRVEPHLARFLNSSANLGLKFPWSIEDMAEGVRDLLRQLPANTYYIRPISLRSGAQIALTLPGEAAQADVAIFAFPATRDDDSSLMCHISPIERVSGRALPVTWKICAAYANSYLVRRTAEIAGFDDGIMLDSGGRICEASAANVLFIRSEAVMTPALTPEVFPGITRSLALGLAAEMGCRVEECSIRPSDLGGFDAAFLASTLMELRPLREIAGHSYSSSNNSVFQELLSRFRSITHQ